MSELNGSLCLNVKWKEICRRHCFPVEWTNVLGLSLKVDLE